MNAWTDNERNKLFNYISKEHNISYIDAKYITNECEDYTLSLTRLCIDFEKILELGQEYQQMLIKRCKKP